MCVDYATLNPAVSVDCVAGLDLFERMSGLAFVLVSVWVAWAYPILSTAAAEADVTIMRSMERFRHYNETKYRLMRNREIACHLDNAFFRIVCLINRDFTSNFFKL